MGAELPYDSTPAAKRPERNEGVHRLSGRIIARLEKDIRVLLVVVPDGEGNVRPLQTLALLSGLVMMHETGKREVQ